MKEEFVRKSSLENLLYDENEMFVYMLKNGENMLERWRNKMHAKRKKTEKDEREL